MYEVFFGLDEKPFSITPNPRFIFYSEHYRNALDQLMYGLGEREGFMMLTGMVGTGKTTLTRELLESLSPKKYRTALIFNPFKGTGRIINIDQRYVNIGGVKIQGIDASIQYAAPRAPYGRFRFRSGYPGDRRPQHRR